LLPAPGGRTRSGRGRRSTAGSRPLPLPRDGGRRQLLDDVDRLALALVVDAHEYLRQQSGGHQDQAGDAEQHSEEREGPPGNRGVLEQPDVGEIREDQEARATGSEAPQAEKVGGPQTMSYPSSSLATRRGMSAGSFCRSPSEVMTISPREWSKPAEKAAVCPKFRRNRSTRTRGSTASIASSRSRVESVDPSSTRMIS